jgi:hypothetical protein
MTKPASTYTHAVRIFIPDAPQHARCIADVIAEFTTLFGHATTYNTSRMWRAGTGKLVSTPMTIIEGTDPLRDAMRTGPAIFLLAQHLKAELGQEVLYQFNTIESVIV